MSFVDNYLGGSNDPKEQTRFNEYPTGEKGEWHKTYSLKELEGLRRRLSESDSKYPTDAHIKQAGGKIHIPNPSKYDEYPTGEKGEWHKTYSIEELEQLRRKTPTNSPKYPTDAHMERAKELWGSAMKAGIK